MNNSTNISDGSENLDSPDTVVKQTSATIADDGVDGVNSLEATTDTGGSLTVSKDIKPKRSPGEIVMGLIHHLNIYLLIFILISVMAIGVVVVSYQKGKKASTPTKINTTALSNDTLEQIKGSDATVGDPKQTLTIASNAIFSGRVLIRDSLDVAGSLKVGSPLTLTGVTVTGSASFDQLQTNGIAVAGNAAVQGALTVQKGITSTSGATFGGPVSAPQISTQSLQLSGDLQIVRHIDAGGSTPGKTDGTALGNGGTASISGTDTAGTVTLNTGGSPTVGCFVTIEFVNKFAATPHVIISPVGSAAGGLNYYTSRTTSNFSICTTNAAPAGQTFSFDYIALD